MATAASLIAAALVILAVNGNWCKGANARTAGGRSCSALHPSATKFDMCGALLKAKSNLGASQKNLNDAMLILRGRIVGRSKDIEFANDKAVFANIAAFLAP